MFIVCVLIAVVLSVVTLSVVTLSVIWLSVKVPQITGSTNIENSNLACPIKLFRAAFTIRE
jgi:hypothetical protein